MADSREPLADLALLAFEKAPELCRPEHRCGDYHRVWGLMRLANPERKEVAGLPFFASQLAAITRGKDSLRLLVSGGADAGFLHGLYLCTRDLPVPVKFIYLDRCATAVAVNRHYADKMGLDIELHTSDLFAASFEPVDVVAAHSFINFFSSEQRPELFKTWAGLLKPGGHLLASNKLSLEPREKTERILVDIDARVANLVELASSLQFTSPQLRELERAARDYFDNPLTQPPGLSQPELLQLLQDAGLRLLQLEYFDRQAAGQQGPLALEQGPGLVRAELVARRPV